MAPSSQPPIFTVIAVILVVAVLGAKGKVGGGWDSSLQYHIQTDEGDERFFKYQTVSGQYRKEKRLHDGSVVGSYGWVDADGLLRLNDYVADDKGYRVVRSRMMQIGKGTPIDRAVAGSKGGAVRPVPSPAPIASSAAPLPPITLSEYLKHGAGVKTPEVEVVPNSYPTSSPAPFSRPTTADYDHYISPSTTERPYVPPVTFRPYYEPNALINNDISKYDGVSLTQNGFRYYLPRHYHEEETFGDKRAGSFGYIDPFGIRRVIYYNTSPGSGFVHRKNNRYVGFNATPYDPRF